MKKMMILASAIMMAAAVRANNVETKPFENVRVNVPARVRIVSGDNYEMGIRSTDSIAAQSILWSIENGVLNIRSRRMVQPEEETPNLCITIVSPVELRISAGRDYEMAVKHGKEGEKAHK